MFDIFHTLYHEMPYVFFLAAAFLIIFSFFVYLLKVRTDQELTRREETQSLLVRRTQELEWAKIKIEDEKDRLNAVLSSMGEGLLVLDKSLRVTLMNQSASFLLRLAPAEAMGKKVEDVFAVFKEGGEYGSGAKLIEEGLEKGDIFTPRLQDNYICRNSAERFFPVTMVVASYLQGNEVTGAVILFRDATEEKRIDQAKTEFVSLASHQLRTPLSAINWYAEMLLDGDAGKVSREQKKYLEEIYFSSQRMVALVNALLNVSRIELGTFMVSPEPSDLPAIIQSVLSELSFLIKGKGMKVEERYDKNLSLVNVDRQLIRIVLQNLLSNSAKYTPAKGKISISLDKKENDVLITVSDSGYGIPASQQMKVFTKLFRADNVREKDTDGTGLGLYIVKSIVEHSGGRIWFVSRENSGTTFFVQLPLGGMKAKSGAKALT